MEFPSIKLNIFKKLEYFLVLTKLNKQFDEQFKILKSREAKGCEFGNFITAPNGEYSFQRSIYPTWEAEKKVLFWSYAYHKLLRHEIKDKHFKDMFVSDKEKEYSGGKDSIFQNLEMRDFGKSECKISKEGLAFGELLWYLYKPINKDDFESLLFGKLDKSSKSYFEVYITEYKLNRLSCGWIILQLQLFALYLLYVYGVALFSFEIERTIGLTDDLQRYFSRFSNILFGYNVFSLIIFLPFFVFAASLIIDIFYKWCVVSRRYRTVEEFRKKNQK